MERENNVNGNVFNDEIAAQIKEIEDKLAAETPVVETKSMVDSEPAVKEKEEKTTHIMPEMTSMEEPTTESNSSSGFDSMFSSLYNDVAGANNFISTLIEQKKKVNLNEASLNEEKQKLEKDKSEFEKYCDTQKEMLRQEKERLDEYERTQKIRLQNEEKEFNAEVEATKSEMALADQGIQLARTTLEEEKQQFEKYKELEEQKISTEKQRIEDKKEEFKKEKEAEYSKIKVENDQIASERKAFEDEKQIEYKSIAHQKDTLEKEKEKFEKYKDNEQKKLEQESKNLSQSCARFKELVTQFNSGFGQLPGKE